MLVNIPNSPWNLVRNLHRLYHNRAIYRKMLK